MEKNRKIFKVKNSFGNNWNKDKGFRPTWRRLEGRGGTEGREGGRGGEEGGRGGITLWLFLCADSAQIKVEWISILLELIAFCL